MIKVPDAEIDVEEIMQKIRDKVKRRDPHKQKTFQEPELLISKPSINGELDPFTSTSSSTKDFPSPQIISQQTLPNPIDIDVLPYYINYHGFLVQVKEKEGLKGRIKSFLFKFIRFFAWWQEQINRALYRELMAQKTKIDERDRWVQELHHQQMDILKKELVERDRNVEALKDSVTFHRQLNDELSTELLGQKAKMGEVKKGIEELSRQLADRFKRELDERDRILEEVKSYLNQFRQTEDELSRRLLEQKANMDGVERRMEELFKKQTHRLTDELVAQKSKIDETKKWVESLLDQQIDGIKGELSDRNKVIESLNDKLVLLGRVDDNLNQGLVLQKEKLDEIEREAQNSLSQGMDNLRIELTEAHGILKNTIDSVKNELAILHEFKTSVSSIITEIRNNKLSILDQQKRLTLFLEEAKKRFPKPISPKQIKNILKEEDHLFDAMYVTFEDQFRGAREDIKERVRVYLPYVRKYKIGERSSPILDLGCGRGEWLELLKENGYIATGVDFNRIMVKQCQDLELDVTESDMLEYLKNQQSDKFGAVTGFHILEHLSFKTIISLFDEALRVLKPSGMVIFETPNPENLIVATCNFYFDPTHRNLLPPKLLNFLIESRGFRKTEIMRLHPYSFYKEETQVSQEIRQLISLFNNEQDYAIISYKA